MTKQMEFEGKTVDDAINTGLESLGVDREKINFEIIEREHSGFLGFGSKPAKVLITLIDDEVIEDEPSVVSGEGAEHAVNFLKNIFEKMGIEAQFETRISGSEVFINITSSEKGFVIGRRGETLDALQYLTMLTVNRGSENRYKISLDTANYRDERVKTLENLAVRLATKAKKTRRNVSLEPMNAYERKIIHSALQNDKSVTTYSVGEEPNRKIIISCKPKRDA